MTATQRALAHDAIVRRCGDIPAWKVSAIEGTEGTLAELDTALAWAAGESDVMGEERRPLEGAAARIYDILMADEEQWEEPPGGGAPPPAA